MIEIINTTKHKPNKANQVTHTHTDWLRKEDESNKRNCVFNLPKKRSELKSV